ncbi:hypothetical protein [Synechococcus sp. MIT S9503]|uniref:hypothetical protein n=1 Tax=Synechococcus sp. MIT S9503 TaxID=3082547 RepID=UPI0039A5140B
MALTVSLTDGTTATRLLSLSRGCNNHFHIAGLSGFVCGSKVSDHSPENLALYSCTIVNDVQLFSNFDSETLKVSTCG